jgi:glycosyltransferase involved in cell wall biosynthesis
MKKILIITHDTSFSGAPLSLLHIFEWIKNNSTHYQFDVLCLKQSEGLLSRFKALSCNFFDFSKFSTKIEYPFLDKVKSRFIKVDFISEQEKFLQTLSCQYDMIYGNTVLALPVISKLKFNNARLKTILHVHELSTVIAEFAPQINQSKAYVDHFIAASELVKQTLILKYSLPKNCITRVYEATKIEKMPPINKKSIFSVVMVGGAYWRKGDDLFIQLANLLKNESIHFYWVGFQSEERKRVNSSDIEKLGIRDNITFIQETDRPHEFMQTMDLFVLTSREDPFPLSVLEAGMLGMPIVCFNQGTGIIELQDLPGVIGVDYLDLKQMANQILFFKSRIENNLFDSEFHCTSFNQFLPENISPHILQVIENC